MPRQKTHKGISKRFKVTASGKAKHRKANRGHILGPKTSKRKRASAAGRRRDGANGQDDRGRSASGRLKSSAAERMLLWVSNQSRQLHASRIPRACCGAAIGLSESSQV